MVGLSPAQAQVATGSLYGEVVDPAGRPADDVRVLLRGFGALHIGRTDANGLFRFLDLDPGTYRLDIESPGFASLEYTAFEIRGGRSTTLRIDLVVDVGENIVVTSEIPLLDERKLSQGSLLSQTELETLPTARDPWAILHQAPGVLVDRINVGGNMSGSQSVFTAPGSTVEDNDWQIDGIQITDMGTRLTPTYYDFDQFAQMEISTGGSDVTKSTPGVSVNLVTKRGTNGLRGSARFILTDADGYFGAFEEGSPSISPSDLGPGQSELAFTGDRTSRVEDLGFEAGGAAIRDRLWFWGAWALNKIDIITGTGQADATTLENSAFKVNGQWSAKNSSVLSWINGDKRKENRGAGPNRAPETLVQQRGPTALYRFEDSHVATGNLFATVTLALQDAGFSLSPTAPGTGTDGPDIALNSRGVFTQNWIDTIVRSPSELVQADLTAFFGTGAMNHEVVFGGRYRKGEDLRGDVAPGRGLIQLAGANFGSPFDFFQAVRSGPVGAEIKRTSLWLQDTLTKDRFTLNIGLRWDRESGRNLPATIPANGGRPEVLPALQFEGRTAQFDDWTTLLPRLGATWAMGSSRQTLLRFSYARFAEALGLPPLQRENPVAGALAFFLFFDQNANDQWDGVGIDGEPMLLSAQNFNPSDPTALTTPNRNAANLSPELTDELVLGIEHALRPELVLDVKLLWREVTEVPEERPIIVDTDGSERAATAGDWMFERTARGDLPDGSAYATDIFALRPGLAYTGGTLRLNGDRRRTYRGVSLGINKRLKNRWSLRGYASFGRAEWKVPSSYSLHANPTRLANGGDVDGQVYFETGRGSETHLQSDWAANLNGLYQVAPNRPWGFSVAATIYARQGYPLPYFLDDISSIDGTRRSVSVVRDLDQFRAPDIHTVDLRLEKRFAATSELALSLSLDAFNLLNDTWVVRRETTYSSQRADWLNETIAPRIYRLGVRLSFR